MIYIFDLDGTLANADHRLHLIHQANPDWDGFFKACVNDAPIKPMQRLFNSLASLNDVRIWTGRNESVREATLRWLQANTFYMTPSTKRLGKDALLMRPANSRIADDVLKERWLHELRKTYDGPIMAFEDRKRVVDMYRRNGVQCLQVVDGDF